MDRKDFLKLIGADTKAEYVPVAFLLKSGYAGIGYYNSAVNEGFGDSCILLNTKLIEMESSTQQNRPAIRDFNEFLEEVVADESNGDNGRKKRKKTEVGKAIPLTAIPLSEFAVLYPVSQIGALLRRSREEGKLPTFFDLSKSEILGLLRLRLW